MHEILTGNVMDRLPELEAESFDAMLCDPPYHLATGKKGSTGFMGKTWDGGDIAFQPDTWREAYRVLKPGAFGLVFGGARTWHRLAVALEDAGFELRDTIMWLYGSGFPKSHDVSKGIDKALGAEREVVGKTSRCIGPSQSGANGIGTFKEANWETSNNLTAPSTPEAATWNGYGTALKPAHESVLLVQKPYSLTQLCGILAHKITEAVCQLPSCAKDAKKSSALSPAEREVIGPLDSALWRAVETCNSVGDLCEAMATLPSGSMIPTSLSTASSWLGILAAICQHANTFTTETASSLTTDLKTLNSLPSAITPSAIIEAATRAPGTALNASIAEGIFSGVSAKLQCTLGPFAVEIATSQEGELDLHPNYEPVLVIRKPSPLTFAQTALEFGCGALNIDGGRIAGPRGKGIWADQQNPEKHIAPKSNGRSLGEYATASAKGPTKLGSGLVGRWPANVILDPEAGAMLDHQTGTLTSGAGKHTRNPDKDRNALGSFAGDDGGTLYGDSGGASRFFYSAKTSKRERNAGLEGDNKHPTLKPIALTQYLATLLLPPDTGRERRILTPYSGAGSEMIGALLAGWDHATGIELSPEYAEIAEARIRHWLKQPRLFTTAAD